MFLTRQIGKVLRGKSTPFQLIVACVLGSLLGFVPGLSQAPGLLLGLIFVLIIVNANLALGALTGILAKLVATPLIPASYAVGKFLLDGPTQGLFKTFVNAPVLAFFGLEYYSVTGGQALGLVFGLLVGFLVAFGMTGFRKKMADLEKNSEKYKNYSSKFWVKALAWIFLGGGDKKESWEDFLQKKIGNPVRPLGIVFVVLCAGLLYCLSLFFKGPILTAALQSGLERANGATVEVRNAEVDFKQNRLTVTGLAVTDPTNLSIDLIRAEKLEADIDTTDLLRKRVRLDKVHVVDATHGEKRKYPGVHIGPPPEVSDPPPAKDPNQKTIDDYIKQAAEWKEKLAKLKEWVENASGTKEEIEEKVSKIPGRDKEGKVAKAKPDYYFERALHLLEESPTFTVGELLAEKVKVPFLEEETLKIQCKNLSSHPKLVKEEKDIVLTSSKDTFGGRIFLGGPSAKEDDSYGFAFHYKGLPADEALGGIKLGGSQPLQGGTIDITTDGGWKNQQGEMYVSLPVTVTLKDSTINIPGGGQSKLAALELPIELNGPLDNPRVNVDTKAFTDVLLEAGKGIIKDKITSEIQKQIGDNLPEGILDGGLKGILPGSDNTGKNPSNNPGGLLEGLLPGTNQPKENQNENKPDVGGLLQGLIPGQTPAPEKKEESTEEKKEEEKKPKPEDAAKNLLNNFLNR